MWSKREEFRAEPERTHLKDIQRKRLLQEKQRRISQRKKTKSTETKGRKFQEGHLCYMVYTLYKSQQNRD